MWEEYAQDYTGFCIGYDFSKGIKGELIHSRGCISALKSILPIFYTDQRPKFDSYNFQLSCYKDDFYDDGEKEEFWDYHTSLQLTLQDLVKKHEYSAEQEWRIILNGEKPGLISFPFASAIYLGQNISSDNKDKLMKIAQKNNLSVYQQKVGNEDFVYECIRSVTSQDTLWENNLYYRKI